MAEKGFWSKLGDKVLAVADFIPGGDIAKTPGDVYALKKAAKAQDTLTEQNQKFQEELLKRIRQARAEGDSERVKRLVKGLQQSTKTDLVKKQLDQTTTNKEIIGDAVELSLLVATGYKPSTIGQKGLTGKLATQNIKALDAIRKANKAKDAAKLVAKFPVAGRIINAAKPIMQEAAIGSAFWGAQSYADGDSPADIARESSKGAIISGGLVAGTKGFSSLFGYGFKKLAPITSKSWRNAIVKLEEIASPQGKKVDGIVSEILKDIPGRESIKQRFAKGTLKTIGEINKLEQKLVDRFAPLRRLEDRLYHIKGSKLDDSELFLKNFRTAQPKALGKAEIEIRDMFDPSGVMGQYRDIEDIVKANIKNLDEIDRIKVFRSRIDEDLSSQLKRIDDSLDFKLKDIEVQKINKQITPEEALAKKEIAERVAKGQKTKVQNTYNKNVSNIGQKVASGKTLEQLESTQTELLSSLDDATKVRLKSSLEDWNNYHRALLQHRANAGLISQETVDELIKTHPNYMPHNVIDDVDNLAIEQFNINNTMNVGKTDVYTAKGSSKQIADPYLASSENTIKAWQIIENNKALKQLVEAQEKYKFVDDAFMYKIKTGTKAPSGKQTIDFFRDGKKETWVVPDDVALAVKGIYDTPKDVPILGKPFVYANTMMKRFATQLNLSFAVPNKFRDLQTAALTADSFIEAMIKKTGANIPKAPITMSKKALYDLWKKSGGAGSSIIKEGKQVSKVLDDIQNTGLWKKLNDYNPTKLLNTFNETLEESTRLEIFLKALNRGLTPEQAAFVSREATIDFAKMGSWTRELNQYIPFLNARVQGFVNLPKSFINNPTNFTRTMLWTSVYPTMGLYKHNRQFQSYENISQYFKDKYWIIMINEVDGKDTDGKDIKIPQFVTLPKGEGQSLVSNPIQYFMERADGYDYRTVDEMLRDTVGSASPLSFQGWSGTNIWTSLISQFGPAASIPVGLGFNKDPFTGQNIIPESRLNADEELQFKFSTPQTTKDLAKAIGVAPANLEFVINSFGGLAQDIQTSVDMLTNKVKGRDLGINPLEDSEFGKLTRYPFTRRIFREVTESYSPEQEMLKERKLEEEKKINSERLRNKDKAQNILNKVNDMDNPDEKIAFMRKQVESGVMTLAVEEQLKLLLKNKVSIDQIRKTDSTELRAKLIIKRLNDFGQKPEVRREFLLELEQAGILTKATLEKVNALLKIGYE